MSDELTVLMNATVAGVLRRRRGGALEFEYDGDYANSALATPLSISMPLQVRTHRAAVVTPWLWGLLPDSDAVLSAWARQFQISASSPYSILATPVGEDCAGAVRFATPERLDEMLVWPKSVRKLSEADVAKRLRNLQTDSAAWLGTSFTGQFSLAGAQAKTALLKQERGWALPSGRAATSHILKPAISGLTDHELNEHLCLDAARRAGLIAARTRVERFGGIGAIVVDRYDRVLTDRGYERVHQEDLCQALGLSPRAKYQNEGGPSAGDIARLLRRVMPPKLGDETVQRFCDALAWNWIIAGSDGHAKNYSLLLSQAEVRLAPLYDVASALPYFDEREVSLAMKLGGEHRLRAHTSNTWPCVAAELELDGDTVIARVRDLAERAADAFGDAARDPHVTSLGSDMPDRLVTKVAVRAKSCARLVEQDG